MRSSSVNVASAKGTLRVSGGPFLGCCSIHDAGSARRFFSVLSVRGRGPADALLLTSSRRMRPLSLGGGSPNSSITARRRGAALVRFIRSRIRGVTVHVLDGAQCATVFFPSVLCVPTPVVSTVPRMFVLAFPSCVVCCWCFPSHSGSQPDLFGHSCRPYADTCPPRAVARRHRGWSHGNGGQNSNVTAPGTPCRISTLLSIFCTIFSTRRYVKSL